MSEKLDDHTLNACLARAIGKEVEPIIGVRLFKPFYEPGSTACSSEWDRQEVIVGYWMKGTKTKWSPLTDANQMEEVEAWLRENEWEYITGWSRQGSNHWAELRNTKKAFWSCDTDKNRAFALAVRAMEQSQKGTT